MTVTKEAITAAALRLRDETGGFGNEDDRAVAEQMLEAALPFLSSRSAEAGKPVVKGLDDSALVKLMYKHLPPKVADDLTIDKHPPMFPQAEYSVPTLSARNFVDALLSALSTPADIEPVAWRCAMGDQYWHYFTKEPRHKEPGEIWEPLYAAPVADREPVSVPEVEALAETLCETFAAADPGDDGTGKAWPYAREWEKASWRAVAKAALFAAAPQPNPSKVDAEVEKAFRAGYDAAAHDGDEDRFIPDEAWALYLAAQGEKQP